MPQDQDPRPSVSQFIPLAHSIAHKINWYPDEHDDVVQEGLLSLHQELLRTPFPDNPLSFAAVVMRRAMWAYIYAPTGMARDTETFLNTEEDLWALFSDPSRGEEGVMDTLFLQEYLGAAQSLLSPGDYLIARNLLDPQEEFMTFILAEVEEKLSDILEKGLDRRGALHKIRPSNRQLLEFLGHNVHSWYQGLRRVRGFTAGWLRGEYQKVALSGVWEPIS